MLLEWIPYAFSALLLLWAFSAGAKAFAGDQTAGRHNDAPPPKPGPTPEQIERRRQRSLAFYQVTNFLLAFVVIIATVLLILGALLT